MIYADLEIKINKIYDILEEIDNKQNIIINKVEKLQEYNEIDDMINAVIDKKLVKIEQTLKKQYNMQ